MTSKNKRTAPHAGDAPLDHSDTQLRPRILYVDDNHQLRTLGRLVLEREGYDVDTARSGAEAWTALNNVRYSLLITDHDMPRVTGLGLIMNVRRFKMEIPIILTSAFFEPAMEPRWDELANVDFFPKPFAIATLVDAVNRIHSTGGNLGRDSTPASPTSNEPLSSNMQPYSHGGINE